MFPVMAVARPRIADLHEHCFRVVAEHPADPGQVHFWFYEAALVQDDEVSAEPDESFCFSFGAEDGEFAPVVEGHPGTAEFFPDPVDPAGFLVEEFSEDFVFYE